MTTETLLAKELLAVADATRALAAKLDGLRFNDHPALRRAPLAYLSFIVRAKPIADDMESLAQTFAEFRRS